MFDRIVVGFDGSEVSERAVQTAIDLARREGAKLLLVHAEERIVGKGGGDVHVGEQEVKADLQRRTDELRESGLDASATLEDVMLGGPAHVIAAAAEREDADLIVVGTHGYSALPGVLVGSVTHRLLHIAGRPVLVVPPEVSNG